MTAVDSKITMTYVAEVDGAIAATRRLASAQDKHAKDGARALNAFERDATSALGKVEKSVQVHERSWDRALKKMSEGQGVFGKAESAIRGFNSTIGVAAMGLGALPKALAVAADAVDLLSAAWTKVSNVLTGSPALRMIWEKDKWAETMKLFRAELAETDRQMGLFLDRYMGADVDSLRNQARRDAYQEEVARQRRQAEGNVDYLSQARLDQQRAEVERQKSESAARAEANERRRRESRGGAGRGAPDFSSGWGMQLGRARDWLGSAVAAEEEVDEVQSALLEALDQLRGGGELVSGFLGPRFAEEGTEIGRRTGGQAWNRPGEQPTILQRMFGEAGDMDVYARAWGTLEDAVLGGYSAIVTGSESAGAAMKRIIGQSIMAEGSRMLILSLREAAWAVAELAAGRLGPAATHGKAALMFGAGAAAAGVAANALGVGGAGSGAAASTGGGVGAGGAGSDAGTHNTYILGDSFGSESPRSQAARFSRARRRADQYHKNADGVDYS